MAQRAFVRRVSARQYSSGGVYRRAGPVVYTTYLQTFLQPVEVQAGVGSITITGYPVDDGILRPGAGSVRVVGYKPDAFLGESTLDPPTRFERRRVFATHDRVYRGRRVRVTLEPFYVRDLSFPVRPGVAAVTVTGYQIRLAYDAVTAVPGVGNVTIDGRGAAVATDVPFSGLSDANLLAMRAAQTRRRRAANHTRIHRPKVYNARIVLYVRERPQRVVGPSQGVIRVEGFAPTLTVIGPITVSVGAGMLTVQGSSPSLETVGLVLKPGAGVVTIDGEAVTLSLDAVIAVRVGVGTLTIIGYEYSLVGSEVSPQPGAGTVIYQGATPTIIATGYWEQASSSETSWTQSETVTTTWSGGAIAETTWTKK